MDDPGPLPVAIVPNARLTRSSNVFAGKYLAWSTSKSCQGKRTECIVVTICFAPMHDYARHLLMSGVGINYVSRWLGHVSIKPTLVYL